jgi:hypothetical protein
MIDFLSDVNTTSDDWFYNACVGHNGEPDERCYARGFLKAAEQLLRKDVLEENSPDFMVYPICFNVRHGIELSLKTLISDLITLYKLTGKNRTFDFSGTHDLSKIWTCFSTLAVDFDIRLLKFEKELGILIKPWAEIDGTGQTFRYGFSKENIKHLQEYSTVDLSRVAVQLTNLCSMIDKIFYLIDELITEYKLNSFTTKLSRYDLLLLARELPQYAFWRSENFTLVKQKWMNERALSSNDFSKACNKIKEVRELSKEVSLVLPLRAATDDQIVWVTELWLDYQARIKNVTNPLSYAKARKDWLDLKAKDIMKALTPSFVADFSSLYYCGGQHFYSEDYDRDYEFFLKQLTPLSEKPDRLFDEFFHVFKKANLLSPIAFSLTMCGKVVLLEKLRCRFDDFKVRQSIQTKTENLSLWYGAECHL